MDPEYPLDPDLMVRGLSLAQFDLRELHEIEAAAEEKFKISAWLRDYHDEQKDYHADQADIMQRCMVEVVAEINRRELTLNQHAKLGNATILDGQIRKTGRLAEASRRTIIETVDEVCGDTAAAAKLLGVSHRQLQRVMRRIDETREAPARRALTVVE